MEKRMFSLRKQLKSFNFAFQGYNTLFKDEHNSIVHLFGSFISIILGFILKINTTEWILIIISIGFVFSMELLNSAVENLSDLVSPEKNKLIRKAKDQGAAAVLTAAISSFAIGTIIFIPKLIKLASLLF